MKLVIIMDSGDGMDGQPRHWAYVVEDDGAGDLVNRHAMGALPVAYQTQDHRVESAAHSEAQHYITRSNRVAA